MNKTIFKGKRKSGNWEQGFYYIQSSNGLSYIYDEGISFEVIPETVRMSLSLTDVNEKEIFEHDICSVTVFDHNGHDTHYNCLVEFSGGQTWFTNNNRGVFLTIADLADPETDLEIIGNLYDNSELLEA